MEMVERVARALQSYEGARPNLCLGVCYFSSDWHDYVPQATIMIEAMREPTEAMKWVNGIGTQSAYGDAESAATWRKMIDEALKPAP